MLRRVVVGLGVVLLAVACGKKNEPAPGDDDDSSKSITVEAVVSDSGDLNFFTGECVAFRILGTDAVFQSGSVQVKFSLPAGSAPLDLDMAQLTEDIGAGGDFVIVSETEILVGPTTFGPCLYVPAFWSTGTADLIVTDSDDDDITLAAAFALTDTPYIDLGTAPAGGSVSSAGNASPRANSLARDGDYDYYQVVGDLTDTYYGFFAYQSGPPDASFLLSNLIVATEPDFLLETFGHQMAIFPSSGIANETTFNAILSEEHLRGGASGFDYTVEFFGFNGTLALTANADTWDDPANPGVQNPVIDTINAGALYSGSFAGKTANYDPKNGAAPVETETSQPNCVNSRFALVYDILEAAGVPGVPVFDNALNANGLDTVYLLTVPDGVTAYVHSYSEGVDDDGNGGDLVLYVLEDPLGDIPDGISGSVQSGEFLTCVAGVDNFGAFALNTPTAALGGDGLWVSNNTGASQTYYLFVDQFTDATGANYAEADFLLWVEYR